MAKVTPRSKLMERVRDKFIDTGTDPNEAYRLAVKAVDAFYAEDREHVHHAMVCAEVFQIALEVMPTFVTHMRLAFESMQTTMSNVAQAATAASGYNDMVMLAKRPEPQPEFDVSGMPVNEGPRNRHRLRAPVNRKGVPCIEEGCENTVPLGVAYCTECERLNRIDGTVEPNRVEEAPPQPGVLLPFPAETLPEGAPAPLFRFDPTRVSFDQGETWSEVPDLSDHTVSLLTEASEAVRASIIVPEGASIGSDDRITGYPHHYVVNGDHSQCPCGGGHLVECEIYAAEHWRHAPSICGIARTNCNHSPRHHYGQICSDYAPAPWERPRPRGCIAHGGPDCVCEVDDAQADG